MDICLNGNIILYGVSSFRHMYARKGSPVCAAGSVVQKAVESKAVLGAICDGTVFLGMNGFLNETAHTSNMLSDLEKAAGERYTGQSRYLVQQAVRDNTLVTANGTAFLEFGKEVMLALKAAPAEEIEEWYRDFKLGYYDARGLASSGPSTDDGIK